MVLERRGTEWKLFYAESSRKNSLASVYLRETGVLGEESKCTPGRRTVWQISANARRQRQACKALEQCQDSAAAERAREERVRR